MSLSLHKLLAEFNPRKQGEQGLSQNQTINFIIIMVK